MVLAENGFDVHVYSLEDVDSPRGKLVRDVGGTYHSAKDEDVKALWKKIGDVDLVYEATGASGLSFRVLELLGHNAIFIFTGVPGRKEPIELDAATIMRNLVLENHVLLGTVNAGPDAFHAAVKDLASFKEKWPQTFETLISGRYPMEEYAGLLSGEVGGIKNIITIGG